MLIEMALAAEIMTNSVSMPEAPKWLTSARVERVTASIERSLEWDIRKVRVQWHSDPKEFSRATGLPGDTSGVLAVTKQRENAIHLGPKVTPENFDGVFGHELAHVILFQKYKDAIPKWLEEGLANYVGKRGAIDYKFLASTALPPVRSMTHPFKNGGQSDPKLHYMASSALMQLLASKCRINDLLQLSVGQTLEGYLGTFCHVNDLDAELAAWVKRQAKR